MKFRTIPTVYEASVPGRRGIDLPALDVPAAPLPENMRGDCGLPELSELDVVRHYTHCRSAISGSTPAFTRSAPAP